MHRLATLTLAGILAATFYTLASAAGPPPVTLAPSLTRDRPALETAIHKAHARLVHFAGQHGWQAYVGPGFITEVQIHESKPAFDRAVTALTQAGPESSLPASLVCGVYERKLLAVSPRAFDQRSGKGGDPEGWATLLTHEMARQLHQDLVKQQGGRKGPVWFDEGFPAVAADLHARDLPTLTREQRQQILFELRRSPSSRYYEALVRYYMTRTPLPELVRRAGEPDFLAWLTATYQDVPTPAPTHSDPYKRSR